MLIWLRKFSLIEMCSWLYSKEILAVMVCQYLLSVGFIFLCDFCDISMTFLWYSWVYPKRETWLPGFVVRLSRRLAISYMHRLSSSGFGNEKKLWQYIPNFQKRTWYLFYILFAFSADFDFLFRRMSNLKRLNVLLPSNWTQEEIHFQNFFVNIARIANAVTITPYSRVTM